ncbi:hypothetical protein Pcinc_021550 [Petrolisthes cinctipes]|uniref:Uncharacterized protein n=1 Tax=Petrolisthes cinctipes TaxID=88211 RepID=A0AAE1FFH4_PETCI|nr:hypothetical protein Pcinc_021550 [Petrolisthes cinctipes]
MDLKSYKSSGEDPTLPSAVRPYSRVGEEVGGAGYLSVILVGVSRHGLVSTECLFLFSRLDYFCDFSDWGVFFSTFTTTLLTLGTGVVDSLGRKARRMEVTGVVTGACLLRDELSVSAFGFLSSS